MVLPNHWFKIKYENVILRLSNVKIRHTISWNNNTYYKTICMMRFLNLYYNILKLMDNKFSYRMFLLSIACGKHRGHVCQIRYYPIHWVLCNKTKFVKRTCVKVCERKISIICKNKVLHLVHVDVHSKGLQVTYEYIVV